MLRCLCLSQNPGYMSHQSQVIKEDQDATWEMSISYTAALAGCKALGFGLGGIQIFSAWSEAEAGGSAGSTGGAGQATGCGMASRIYAESTMTFCQDFELFGIS